MSEQSFESIAQLHGSRIRQIARRYAPPGEVDDLVQDILIRLWRSWSTFRGESDPMTFIYRVALNAAMTYVKRRVRYKTRMARLAALRTTDSIADGENDADILERFLRQVDDIDASILMMTLDGMSSAAIANVLGVTPNTVAIKKTRLQQKFRDVMVD